MDNKTVELEKFLEILDAVSAPDQRIAMLGQLLEQFMFRGYVRGHDDAAAGRNGWYYEAKRKIGNES